MPALTTDRSKHSKLSQDYSVTRPSFLFIASPSTAVHRMCHICHMCHRGHVSLAGLSGHLHVRDLGFRIRKRKKRTQELFCAQKRTWGKPCWKFLFFSSEQWKVRRLFWLFAKENSTIFIHFFCHKSPKGQEGQQFWENVPYVSRPSLPHTRSTQ